MKVGRNEPCPCGSGLKYKNCHLGTEAGSRPPDDLWHRLHALSARLPTELLRFASNRYGRELLNEAWLEFAPFEDQQPFDPDSIHIPVFMPWFFYHWRPETENTVVPRDQVDRFPIVSLYLSRRGRREEPLVVRYLEACRRSALSFLQIDEVSVGAGLSVTDTLTGWQGFVSERSGSESLRRGDIVLAKVVTLDDVSVLDGCSPIAFPPLEKATIIKLRNHIRKAHRSITPEVVADYDLELLEVYHSIAERLLNPALPELSNTDGDPLEFCRLTYEVPSPKSALDALRHLALGHDEAELLAGATFDQGGELLAVEVPWLKRGSARLGMGKVGLGSIRIEGRRLVAEVNSQARALRFRKIADRALPAGSRHLSTVVEPIEAALKAFREETPDPPPDDDLNQRPEIQALLKEHLRAHYRAWVDEAVPALAGKTPRQAMKTKDGREMVEALLLGLEQRAGQQPGLDHEIVAELRATLGTPTSSRSRSGEGSSGGR
ncbi:MAG TPA: SEC-C metal-binding domain-containing protein [Candidatus Nitrosotalea sp.]|nr:SEC-C metal-binding domain-containing protein [Candidatus Nitrosotalea sp.]